MSKGRLAIGGPTRDTVPASFAVDLAQLYAYTKERGPWETVTVGFLTSTYIHMGREYFLESCLKQGATHVLWLDTDMSFPQETAVLLASHDEPFVACNYVTRDGTGRVTARRDRKPVEIGDPDLGLERVDSVGLGVALIRTDILTGMTRPWFRHGQNAHGGDIGEDIEFCRRIGSLGHRIYVDNGLSLKIGHIGQHTYTPTVSPVPV